MSKVGVIRAMIMCILVIICIQSCGYRMAEEDRYPNMSVYPQMSSSNYSIDSLIEARENILYTKEFMYLLDKKETNDTSALVVLSILDKNMNIIKKVAWKSFENSEIYTVDIDNTIYIVATDRKLYKYVYPWDQIEYMDKLLDVTETDSLTRSYSDIIEQRKKNDSTFYVGGFIDSIFNSRIRELYDNNTCVLPIDKHNTNYYVILNDSVGKQSYVVVTDYSELWQTSYQNRKLRCDSLVSKYTFDNEYTSPNLILEQVALGNRGSGNHVVFGFTPYGYDYYRIIIDKDTLSFKIKNNNLDRPVFSQVASMFTDKIILRKENTLYIVRRKN